MSATVSPLARRLKRLWQALPAGEWLSEDDVDERIIRHERLYEGDRAAAGAVRAQLCSARALIARRVDGSREIEYRKAETWTEWPDSGYGSDAFNAELRRLSEAEQARLRDLDEQRARELEDSPLAWQRRMMIELIDERVAQKFAELTAGLDDDLLARMRARVRDIETNEKE